MRRSSAPSKRGGFQPPLKRPKMDENSSTVQPPPAPKEPLLKSDMDFMAELGIQLSHSSQNSSQNSQNSDFNEETWRKVEERTVLTDRVNAEVERTVAPLVSRAKFKPVFRPPTADVRTPAQRGSATADTPSGGDPGMKSPAEADVKTRYYSVMWCKLSKKKHKKWEGDAILVTRGRSVTLQDLEGKDIGKSSGYKLTELATLIEGQTLVIGGKEIEVMGMVSECDYQSGKCFTSSAGTPTPVLDATKPVVAAKPFVRPQKDGENTLIPSQPSAPIQPRHDPLHPDAVVMPRPPARIKPPLPVVDVVLDPYLTRHLRPHQELGVRFLYECLLGYRDFQGTGAILADDMGLGKTLQCITLIWTLLKQGPFGGKPVIKRALIVTPGSLVKNWRSEFKKWLGDERISVYAVGQDRKIDDYLLSNRWPVLIISYEMFIKLHACLRDVRYDVIVCDEGHRLKNAAIKTTALLSSLSCRRRVVLSGTPVQNDLLEFFSIVDFCNPGVLGTSASFSRVYGAPILASRQPGASVDDVTMGESRGQELARLTDLFVLRRTSDINNDYLPPKTEFVVFCRPTQLQLLLYRTLLTSRLFRECLSQNSETGPLVCIDALKKLTNHPALLYRKALTECQGLPETEPSVYRDLISLFPPDFCAEPSQPCQSGKLLVLDLLLSDVHACAERVVLVSNYTKTLSILQALCEERGYRYLRLDGQTPTARRLELVQRFNSKHSDISVFLLSSKAGGTGLNLVGASRLVLYDIDWNPATDLQAMARVWRDGQRRHVRIYRLLTTGSIEEKIYQRQICKQGLSGAVVGKEGAKNVHFSQEDLRDLFTLREDCDCDTHDLLACSCHGDGIKPDDDDGCHSDSRNAVAMETSYGVATGSKKNLSMVELLSWQHADSRHLEEALDNAESYRELVSYVFWNVSNAKPGVK